MEKFSATTIRIKSSSPKIIPLALCLFYVNHLGEYDLDERGHVFEALIGAQLVRTGEALYYWREGPLEVDFVVKRGRSLWAVEVKSGRRKRLDGVNAFKKQYPSAKSIIITPETYMDFEADPIQFLTDHAI